MGWHLLLAKHYSPYLFQCHVLLTYFTSYNSHTKQANGNLSSGEEPDVVDGRRGHRVLSPGVSSIKRANSLSKKPSGE